MSASNYILKGAIAGGGVISKQVDYAKAETLVEVLRGQDASINTLSGRAHKETDNQLIHAAGEAGVAWILPMSNRNIIANLGKSSYIAVSTGFWCEWSLAVSADFGIDLTNHAVTLFDEGKSGISTSTLAQVGSAVAALHSLPIKPEVSHQEVCLEDLKNKVVNVSSFTVSQRSMLESVLRMTDTKESDWNITKEPAKERIASGIKEIQEGEHSGYPKMIAQVFYYDGCGDFENSKGTLNRLLGLPKEDTDEATKAAIERSKSSP